MQINQYIIKEQNITSKKPLKMGVFTDCFNSVQSVAITFLVKVGGLHENNHNYGISHFLEHMLFKGTKKLNYLEIARKFDEMGGNFNAYTSRDRTVFFAKVLKSKAKEAVDLLSEIIFHSTLPQQELEKERNVILQEISQNKEDYEHNIFDLFYENTFFNQPLGQDLLGNPNFIKSVSKDELHNYMHKHYTTNNIIVALSGNFNEAEIVPYINEKLEQAGRVEEDSGHKEHKLPKSIYTPKIAHKVAQIEQTHMILGFEGVDYHSEWFYFQNLACAILGEGMSSRLFQKIREQQGLAYNITSFTGSFHDTGILGVYAAADPKDIYHIVQLIKLELHNLAKAGGILERELEIAKTITLSSILMAMESNSTRAEKIASNYLTFGRFIAPNEIKELVEKVSVNDIIAFFEKFVLQSAPTFVSIGNRVDEKVYTILDT